MNERGLGAESVPSPVAKRSEGARFVARPLLEVLPKIGQQVSFVGLGSWPTPVERITSAAIQGPEVFIKRDDLSSPLYGGNKVRTLEVLMGAALRNGCEQVVSTGAYGSNHAVATVLHARALGLGSGAILCPQPPSRAALENLEVTLSCADVVRLVRHWSLVPLAIWQWRSNPARRCMVMPPGGATPLGALGYVSAAFELAEQIRDGQLPSPKHIVLPVGSTCTTAGLLVGLSLVRRLGLGFARGVPRVVAVRVTPWPVTSPVRIIHLARSTSELLVRLTGDARMRFSRATLSEGLQVDARFLGAGYGQPTRAGREAIAQLGTQGLRLDTTYSAKAAAALFELVGTTREPVLFWGTKSTAPLPPLDEVRLRAAPVRVARWMQRCRALAVHG